jgi:hypothetical protein
MDPMPPYIFELLNKDSSLLATIPTPSSLCAYNHPLPVVWVNDVRPCYTYSELMSPKTTGTFLTSTQFYLGPQQSGSPMHFHEYVHCKFCTSSQLDQQKRPRFSDLVGRDAVNSLVYGRKQWILASPSDSLFSKQHPVEWTASLASSPVKDTYFRCVQEEGDLFYVPRLWGHAVINTEDTIGYATEFAYHAKPVKG